MKEENELKKEDLKVEDLLEVMKGYNKVLIEYEENMKEAINLFKKLKKYMF